MTQQDQNRTKLPPGASHSAMLHVLGKNEFNNEILANYLSEHSGISSCCRFDCDIGKQVEKYPDKMNLILLDAACLKELTIEQGKAFEQVLQAPNCRVILFQVDPGDGIDLMLLNKGIRGILYNEQPITMFLEALRAVLKGELFFPRQVLERVFLGNACAAPLPNKDWCSLTAREKDILMILAAGKSNQEIARALCLSHHTIKTHIYNVYKKLGVRSRLQAIARISEWHNPIGLADEDPGENL